MARDGTVTVKITGDAKGLQDALGDSDGHLDRFGGKMGGVAKGVGTAFAGMGVAAFGFGVASVKAFMEAEQVAAQTGAVIKSTGGVAKVTAKDVDTLAGSLSAMSGVDDEAIASGENLLLTFTKVRNETGKGNDIFNQGTKAALDMSVAMGTDMTSAAMLVGKALNDPVKGMTALTKSGIQFTDEQKKTIKALVDSGDEMGAQKIILKELETQFGGSAKAAGETFAGQLNKLKVVAGNFMEDVGAKIVPVLMDVGKWLGDNVPAAIETARPTFERIVAVIKDIVPVVQDVIGWIQDFVAKFRGGQGEIGESAGKLGEIVNQIKEAFDSAFEAIKAIVKVAADIVTDIWDRFGETLLEFIKGTWNGILEVFRGAFRAIDGVFDLIKAVFTGKWGEAWTAIKQILDGAWDVLFGVIRNALTNVIPTLFEAAKTVLSGAFGLMWNALKTVASDAMEGIKRGIVNGLDAIVNFFKDLPGRLAGLGRGMFNFIGDAFKAAINWVIQKWNDFHIPAVRVSAFGVTQTVTPDIPFPDITPLAGGGIVSRPTLAMIGEAGPEAVIPLSRMGSGGGSTVVNNYLTIEVSALTSLGVSEAVITAIKEYERRNGSDWRVA